MIKKSVRISTLFNLLNSSSLLIKTSILSFFLTPQDFGIMALLSSFIELTKIFTDSGLNKASMVFEISNNTSSSIFFYNIVLSIFSFAIIYFVAPLIANFYENVELIKYLQVFSLTYLITSFSKQYAVILMKNFEQHKISKNEFIANIISILIAIILAVNNFGVWSLILSALAYQFLRSVLIIITARKYFKLNLYFSYKSIRPILNVSKYQLFEKVYLAGIANIDNFLIGKFFSLDSLGIYFIYKKFLRIPYTLITVNVTRVFLPYFTKFQLNTATLNKKFLELSKIFIEYSSLLFLVIIIGGPAIIDIFYDSKFYDPLLLFLLGFTFILKSWRELTPTILLVIKKADQSFYLIFWQGIVLIICILIGCLTNIHLLCIFIIIAETISIFISYKYLRRYFLHIGMLNIISSTKYIIIINTLSLFVCLLFMYFASKADINAIIRHLLATGIFITLYYLLSSFFKVYTIQSLYSFIRGS